ncbi:hypothetical protein [Shinella sp. JR1-6]|uniref:hypothetical protein n=1 Tax=Shinella sp. JR1-6 TaxID=2527671 RepID=UPI00102D56C1|nr:hypothetical protein [Shinella sp. JR1-6]TAA54063.1 hypothetical protein EXZ48_27510 [Shinella sp. JR1-6]
MLTIDSLAQEIRRVDGNHSLGAGALAEALMPFISAALSIEQTRQGVEVRGALFSSLTAMTIASALPGVSREYDFSHAINTVRVALEAARPVKPDAKPLVWETFLGSQIAKTAFDTHYTVQGSTTADGKFAVLYSGSITWPDTSYCHGSIEAAKSAAQQDYETRIRSAIVGVAAVEPEPVAWMYQFKTKSPVLMVKKRNWAETHSEWTETPLYAHPPTTRIADSAEAGGSATSTSGGDHG